MLAKRAPRAVEVTEDDEFTVTKYSASDSCKSFSSSANSKETAPVRVSVLKMNPEESD